MNLLSSFCGSKPFTQTSGVTEQQRTFVMKCGGGNACLRIIVVFLSLTSLIRQRLWYSSTLTIWTMEQMTCLYKLLRQLQNFKTSNQYRFWYETKTVVFFISFGLTPRGKWVKAVPCFWNFYFPFLFSQPFSTFANKVADRSKLLFLHLLLTVISTTVHVFAHLPQCFSTLWEIIQIFDFWSTQITVCTPKCGYFHVKICFYTMHKQKILQPMFSD